MRNIEIKARLGDYAAARATAGRLAAQSGGSPLATSRVRQVDTYFRVPEGRLKLRETEDATGAAAELISYRRAGVRGPKRCDYAVAPISHPGETRAAIAEMLGIRVVVEKRRDLYLWRNVRIHLDTVAGLGRFVEFEAVLPDGAPESDGEALVRRLMDEFGVREEDLVEHSYADLLEEAGGG